jgi:uncharacterized protein YdbL (DUF1318 family)
MMNKLVSRVVKKVSLASAVLAITFSAWAMTLEQAKEQGLVGEMANGYLGVVSASPEINSLVKSVNDKRKEIYLNLARKNNLSIKQVTTLAGEKSIKKTKAGNLIQSASGQWVKK